MATFFFILTVLFVFLELVSVANGAEISLELRKLKTLKGDATKRERQELIENHAGFLLGGIFYVIWLFIGAMMSAQWVYFTSILCLGFAGSLFTNKLSDKWYVIYKYADVTITVAILVWMAWHHFHH